METTILSLAMLNLNELEAFVELMFLAAYTDGAVNEAERGAFRGQVVKGTHGQLDPALVDMILKHVESTIGATPADERDAQLASIRDRLRDPRKRRAALVHAARVVLADGILGLDEVEFLKRATIALGEPPELADQVLREAREQTA